MAVQVQKSIFVVNGVEIESWNESRAILDYAHQILKWPKNSVYFDDFEEQIQHQTIIYSSRTNERCTIGPVNRKG